MRFRVFTALILTTCFLLLAKTPIAKVYAQDSHPDMPYELNYFFPLFRYIKPSLLKVFENEERDRTYPALYLCNDNRLKYPCHTSDDCTGTIDFCEVGSGKVARSEQSPNGRCQKPPPPKQQVYRNGKLVEVVVPNQEDLPGTCKYNITPTNPDTVKTTDFSNPLVDSTTAGGSSDVLVYPKLQNEAYRYDFNSGSDNAITWGAQNLSLTACDQLARQAIVVHQAKYTKSTVNDTGEWPLGWVDWNYKTPNGTSLIDIYQEMPGNVAGDAAYLTYAHEKFLVTVGGEQDDASGAEKNLCDTFDANPTAKWAIDLNQAPLYPPSETQGFVRDSICVWNQCCPGPLCPIFALTGEGDGPANGVYTDTSVHPAFAAAIDDLFLTYPFQTALKIYRDLVVANPLVRYVLVSEQFGIPSRINQQLQSELENTAVENCDIKNADGTTSTTKIYYVRDLPNPLKLGRLGTIYDYQGKMDAWCYGLQPAEIKKEYAGAYNPSPFQTFINIIYSAALGATGKVDIADMITNHRISIPDAMGQSLGQLQAYVYNTRDTTTDLATEKYATQLSNTIQDTSPTGLFVGKTMGPGDSKRRLGYFTCSDPEYSAPEQSSIQEYATGTRIGCAQAVAPTAGLCDGTKFAALVKDSPWTLPLPQAVQTVMSSKMFVNGALNPDLAKAYSAAEQATGVPCEVLAGIHFEEATDTFTGGGDPTKVSVTSGHPLAGQSLTDNAIVAANELLHHPPTNTDTLITAISDYNGGGNSNCQQGYPYPIPYGGCPRQFIGDDDPYATNLLDARHTNMYLLYHGDLTQSAPTPYGTDRPGAFAVALAVYSVTSKNAPVASGSASPAPSGNAHGTVNPTSGCGLNEINTALGCVPFGNNVTAVLFGWIASLAGAIALVVMLVGTVMIMTAGGNEEQVKKGRELFTGAVTGLLFVIFSVVLLRTIAGNIIKIPGF